MKRLNEAVGWGIFLFVAGVFLLLWNLDVFGAWGALAWGALYALTGLGFLIWFATGVGHWWRAIPAFTLLSAGAAILLDARGMALGAWRPAIVLFGMALGFWAILVVRKEHWWALVPAGVLTTVGLLFGLWERLGETGRLPVLFVGIGLMFLLLYVIRYDERDARWAAIPAGAVLLLGVVTLVAALSLPAVLAEWWPLVLVVGGLVLAALGLAVRRPAAVTPTLSPEGYEALPPAPGASVQTHLPAADTRPSVPDVPASTGTGETVDIYKVIEEQPKDE